MHKNVRPVKFRRLHSLRSFAFVAVRLVFGWIPKIASSQRVDASGIKNPEKNFWLHQDEDNPFYMDSMPCWYSSACLKIEFSTCVFWKSASRHSTIRFCPFGFKYWSPAKGACSSSINCNDLTDSFHIFWWFWLQFHHRIYFHSLRIFCTNFTLNLLILVWSYISSSTNLQQIIRTYLFSFAES